MPGRALPGEAAPRKAAPPGPRKPEHTPTVIEDIADFNESANILVYGDSGVGKTVLCGTAPNCLLATSEPGAKAAKRQGSTAKLKRLTVWQDAWDLLHGLQDGDPQYEPFDWIAVDTATTLQEKHLKAIVRDEHASNPARDRYVPQIQDRQKWHLEFKDWIVQMVDVPKNMIFTAHAMWKEQEQDGEDICLPSFQGMGYQVANYICGHMDAVGYMATILPEGKTRPVRRILWEKYPPYFAKDQFNALGRWTDNTNMPELISKIFGEQKGEA